MTKRILPDRPLTQAEKSERSHAAHPELRAERGKRYRDTHPDRVKADLAQWWAANPGKRTEYRLKSYGITPQGYEAILAIQDNACAICKKPSEVIDFEVDHDHATGRVRGLLCRRCNNCLGWFEKNGLSALEYLEDPNGSSAQG